MRGTDFTLDAYENILSCALESDYEFRSFDSMGSEHGERSCLLRHDIDADLFACDKILAVERTLGIQATYFVMTRSTAYNLFCVEGREMVARILSDGHALGLHFMGELCEGDGESAIVTKVLREKAWLEAEFGIPVRTVSFHQPTRAILDGQLVIPGMVNTYNRAQMDPYFYISDTNMTWRHEHPLEVFKRGLYPRLQFLVHPIWWTQRVVDLRRKWLGVLDTNRDVILEHWQSREGTLRKMRLTDDE